MKLASGDLILFEPYLSEIKDTLTSWWNSSKYSHVGLVLRQSGTCYCIDSRTTKSNGKFDVSITRLEDVQHDYNGQLWMRKLDHWEGPEFQTRIEKAITLLEQTNATRTCSYGASAVAFIYRFLDIFPYETRWEAVLPNDFSTEKMTTKNNQLLWLYTIWDEKKLEKKMYID